MFALIRIALRNVTRNRRRSLITLSAVFLALTVMVGVRGLLNGLQATIREGVVYGQTGAVQVHRKGFLKAMQGAPLDLDLPADEAFLGKIRAVPHVTAVAARIPFGGMVNHGDQTVFSLFTALDPVAESKVCPQRYERVKVGRPLDPADPTGGDFTTPLLSRLGVKVGDGVAILTNDRDGVLNAVDMKVIGSFPEPGLFAADKKVGFIPLPLAQELLRMPGRATEVAIAVDPLDRIDEVVAALRPVVGPEYEVSSWHDVAGYVDEIVKNQNLVLNLISNIFLFMALLGILNTMLMSVRERTREIGTMMAVGVRRRQILALFLLEASLLGLVGGALGLAAGYGIIHHYAGEGIVMRAVGSTTDIVIHPFITAPFVARTFVVSIVGAAVAALLPSFFASRLRPVEALGSVA
ncbi:MAG: ABC transporter permease [Myxococcales bacterium]|nr:ABC transporter permease [Myxococcales bacterium]